MDLRRMSFRRFFQAFGYSGYDRSGRLKILVGRPAAPEAVSVAGVADTVRDEALQLLCDAFDIPAHQQYCLRLNDSLASLYQARIGPRWWDDMEFERLVLAFNELPGPELTTEQLQAITTVEDVIRLVAERRT